MISARHPWRQHTMQRCRACRAAELWGSVVTGDDAAFLPFSAGTGLTMLKTRVNASLVWDDATYDICMKAAVGHTMQRMYMELSEDGKKDVSFAELPTVAAIKTKVTG